MLKPYPWQQQQWRRLTEAADQGRLAHALLLGGADGMGIEEFARALAARLLCEQPAGNGACGTCRSCYLFLSGNHPDLFSIVPEQPGKAIRVDAIRELIDYIHLSSQYGRYKIAVLEPAEVMNRNAANSLLKTLEEPPPDSVLILNSRRPSFLPVTIRSRCQQVNFPPQSSGATRSWLSDQLDGNAEEFLAMARGRPLAALHLEEDGTLDRQTGVLSDLEQLKTGDASPGDTAKRWLDHGPGEVMQWLLVFIQIMTRQKLVQGNKGQANNRFHETLAGLAGGMDLLELLKWYDIVFENYRAATGPYNLNQQGLLEEILVNWQALTQTIGRSRQ